MDWSQKNAIVCTMHGKETVIEPVLNSLGFNWISAPFNTDQFGTFTGEIERKDTPLEAATKKCELAFNQTDATIAVASEGSFGPHPTVPFLPINEEIILFWDKESNVKITVSSLTTETNFSSKICHSSEDLLSFANQVGFPEHGLILSNDKRQKIYKGITDEKTLQARFNQLMSIDESVCVETDMRAHLNPTRMKHIASLAGKLKAKLLSVCPSCDTPGFGEEHFESGLPCSQCGLPTSSIKTKKTECTMCSYTASISYPNGKKVEDPQFCSFCNP